MYIRFLAFVEIQEEYADNAIHHMHGSLFYGKEIKVAYSKHNRAQERSQDQGSESLVCIV